MNFDSLKLSSFCLFVKAVTVGDRKNIILIHKKTMINYYIITPGQQIEGVWHTSIVVYEREYFYGGGGVTSCAPVGTTQYTYFSYLNKKMF